ncbi:MAG: hypothetical protein ACREYF_20820 [Gammaproteobacteria bacterium]
MNNTVGKIWHADFVIDTNVLSNTGVDESKFNKLLDLVKRMTSKDEYGCCWFAITSLLELTATKDLETQVGLLKRFLRLSREAGGRFRVLSPLPRLIEAEWKREDRVTYFDRVHLEALVQTSLEAGTLTGTPLGEIRDDFLLFKDRQLEEYESGSEKYVSQFKTDPRFREAVEAALRTWKAPEAYSLCDDLALRLMQHYAKLRESAFGAALKNPDDYLSTWAFALLVRLSQIAQTIPGERRATYFAELGLPNLKPNRNDILVSCPARNLHKYYSFSLREKVGLRGSESQY